MERIFASLFVIALIVVVVGRVSAGGSVQGKDVDYSSEGIVMKGYLSYNMKIKGKQPGVLVVHEWWGDRKSVV